MEIERDLWSANSVTVTGLGSPIIYDLLNFLYEYF